MRIAVAMSGGVDSSVAAALLLEQGHEVVGFTLKVWDASRCCSIDDVDDARRVARHLGIPFYVLEAREAFEAEVIEPFVAAYGAGLTPNPCILCNQTVKFRWLLGWVRAVGCEVLATGHYARVDGEAGVRHLRAGLDAAKDQSYFLVPAHPSGLDQVIFPLGSLRKAEVRGLAADRGLPVARKAESQDVCFVERGGLAGFLEGHLGPATPGAIVDTDGRVLGRHRGLHAYTVGQRKGLGISASKPLYVVGKDLGENRLIVGPRGALRAAGLEAGRPVFLAAAPAQGDFPCTVKIRSTAPAVPCRVERAVNAVRVRFAQPQFGVAPGQMAVFYAGDEVLGGAWIERALEDSGE